MRKNIIYTMTSNLDLGQFINFKILKRFGIITIARPEKANALTLDMVKNLKKAIVYCQENRKIRGILLTGSGNTFTTGLDLDSIDGKDHQKVKEYEMTAAEIVSLIFYGKPTICAINGRAMGDGVAYTLCSDYRLAVKDSFFMMPEIKIGVFPGAGTVVLMSKTLGINWTKRILMFAEKISAKIALKIGLIDEIVENNNELMKSAMKKARFLFTKNQVILNSIKLCSNHLGNKSFPEAYEFEKKASYWFEQENKDSFIDNLRKELISDT
ncbi:MAG: hypothetical protein GF353_14115 [Candidatus Lokiarchaeota archaeon]|nr:hypothetical protein [Candidatus Lokiarchaeota archaeon]